MPINSESLNRKLYDLLTVRGYNPKPLDVEGKVTPVPEESAVMKFDFVKDDKNYGQVWISIDGSKTLQVYYGDAVADSPSDKTRDASYDDTWTGLIRHLKNWAQRRQLGFELKNENHLESDMAKRSHTAKKEKISEASTSMAAGKSNSSFIITAKTAEGATKTYRVKAQSPNMAKEKFSQHHSMAKILNVSEEGVAEGSYKTYQPKHVAWVVRHGDGKVSEFKPHEDDAAKAQFEKVKGNRGASIYAIDQHSQSIPMGSLKAMRKKQDVAEGYWQDAVKKAEADREARKGKPFEKNPASHDEKGIYKGDKDLAGNPVPKRKEEGVAEMDNRTPSGDRKEQRANSSEAIAQREKEQQANLKKVSPEMRKKLRLPDPDKEDMAEDIASTRREVNLKKKIDKGVATPEQKREYQELKAKNMGPHFLKSMGRPVPKQDVAEGLLAQSDEFKVELDDDGMVHVLDGEGTIRVSMPVNIWKRMAGKKGQVDEFSIEVSDGQVHVLDGEGTIRVSMPVNIWKQLGKQDAAHERKRSLQATRDFNRSRSSGMMEQDMAEGQTGVSVKKWAAQVRQEHGADTKFSNDKVHDRVIARKDKEIIGSYDRKANNGTVFSPDSIKEGTDDSTQVLSDIVANEDFDALYNLMSSDTEAGKIVQRMYNDVSGEEGLHPDDDFEKILSIVLDHLTQDYGQQNVAEANGGHAGSAKVRYTGGMHGEYDPTKKQASPQAHLDAAKYHNDEANTYIAAMNHPKSDQKNKEWYKNKIQHHKNKADFHIQASGQQDVAEGSADKTVRVIKRNGKPIGEIGIDPEASPGNGSYYVKLYDGSVDESGFDTAEEALAELKYLVKQNVSEGYSLKKTSVSKHMEPGDPEEYTQDVNIKDTDYEIINNKTGQVVGTASQTTNDFMGSGALKITMKNGATRWLDIWDSEKGNPQTAFNRFVKDPKTASKYKGQDMKGVTEMDKSQTPSGRDGHVSHSTYGSRDKGDSTGPERTAKPVTAKQATTNAMDILNKQLKKKDVAEAKGDEYYDLTAEHVPIKAIPLIKKELAQAGITLKWVKPRKYFEYETIFEIVTNEKGLKVAKNIIWKYNKGNYVGIMNEQNVAEGQESMKQVSEGYYPMGKQGSYSDAVPTTKIIIQHSRKIEEGEQRYRNIAKIFVENTQGERFAVPTIKPGIARVYARHIAEGGTPYDERGKHITSLVEEYSKMAGFVRATKGKQFNESAQQLVNEGLTHYQSLRESLRKMTGHRGYNAYFESWTPSLMEDGEEQTNLNELFVQETLDPRIESVMPILSRLHKKVSEMAETGQLAEWADSLLDETLNVQEENVPLRDKEDLQARRKAIQDIISDPDTAKDPLLKREVMKRKHDLEKEAEAKRLAEEMVDESANVPMDVRTLYAQTYAKFAKTAGAAKGAKQMAYAMVEKKYGKEIADKLKAYHNSNLDEELGEDLDSNQKRVGQLGPTEKVGPKGAVGKLVGANESVVQGVAEGLNEINSNGQEDLDAILRIIKK
jgi:hypothetical protein